MREAPCTWLPLPRGGAVARCRRRCANLPLLVLSASLCPARLSRSRCSFLMPNIRTDLQFVLASTRSGSSVVLATSAKVTNAVPNQPTNVKVRADPDPVGGRPLGGRSRRGPTVPVWRRARQAVCHARVQSAQVVAGPSSTSVSIQWITRNARKPVVRFGTSPRRLWWSAAADKVPGYTQQDILNACGWGTRTLPADANVLSGEPRPAGAHSVPARACRGGALRSTRADPPAPSRPLLLPRAAQSASAGWCRACLTRRI